MNRAAPLSIPPLVRNVLTAERLLARVARGRAFAWDDRSTSGRRATLGVDATYGARRTEFSRALMEFADTGLGAEACTLLRIAHAVSLPVTYEAAFATIISSVTSGSLALSVSDAAQLAGLEEVANVFAPADVESLGVAYLTAGDVQGAVRAATELARAGDMLQASSLLDKVVARALLGPITNKLTDGQSDRESACRIIITTLTGSLRDETSRVGPLLWDAALRLALHSPDARDASAAKLLWAALVSVSDVLAARCIRRAQARRGRAEIHNDTALAAAVISLPLHANAYEGIIRAAAVRGDAQTAAAALGHWASFLVAVPPQSSGLSSAFSSPHTATVFLPPSGALVFLVARTMAAKGDWAGALDAVKVHALIVGGGGGGGGGVVTTSLYPWQ